MIKMATLIVMLLLTYTNAMFANDGAYITSGNQLIPINEKDITVKKEILSIKKVEDLIYVTVYYEFFNPKQDKEVLVGFEAMSPSGDVNATPVNGKHPYIFDFTVDVNNSILPYKVAIVNDSNYYSNNGFKKYDAPVINNVNEVGFFYVYHFKARFKKGLNIVKHTYAFTASSSVMDKYSFDYVLTAAKRWANKQIDDFTLNIDMGAFESFYIAKTFFTQKSSWILHGMGKAIEVNNIPYSEEHSKATQFHMHNGSIIYTATNFKPKGELYIAALRYLSGGEPFSASKSLPLNIKEQMYIGAPVDDMGKKILKNLAFARRGYIFSNIELQQYFEKNVDWYLPNPNYEPLLSKLTTEEQEFSEKYK